MFVVVDIVIFANNCDYILLLLMIDREQYDKILSEIRAERTRRASLSPSQRDWEDACKTFEGLADAPLDPPCRDLERDDRTLQQLQADGWTLSR